MDPSNHPEEKLIEGILMTRFGRDTGDALEQALQKITAAQSGRRHFPYWKTSIAIAASLALAAGLIHHNEIRRTGLTLVGPDVRATVLQSNTFRPAGDGATLSPGQTLRAGGPVRLKYEGEKTSLSLSGNGELEISSHRSGKNLKLLGGSLVASVAPQKIPMRVDTPAGTVEVIGTRFEVDAPSGATWLRVDEGSVKWRARGKHPVFVKAGECVVDALGINPGPHAIMNNNLPRLPFSWSWETRSTEGDGEWTWRDGILRQSKVAMHDTGSVPDSLPGQPKCPVSVGLAKTPTAASFRVECSLTIDGVRSASSGSSSSRETAGMRFLFEDHFLEILTGRNPPDSPDPSASYQALSLTHLDPARGYPSEILHGGLAPDFAKASYRIILQLEREAEGGAVIRGKIWAASAPEPVYWSLQAWVPKLGELKQSGGVTAHCSATFSNLAAYLLP